MNWHHLKTQIAATLLLLSAAVGASAQTTACAPTASVNLPVVNTGLPVVQIWIVRVLVPQSRVPVPM